MYPLKYSYLIQNKIGNEELQYCIIMTTSKLSLILTINYKK